VQSSFACCIAHPKTIDPKQQKRKKNGGLNLQLSISWAKSEDVVHARAQQT
jgi:hypothetical protein